MLNFQTSMNDFLQDIINETGLSASYEFEKFGMTVIDTNGKSDEVPEVNSKIWINISSSDENGVEQSGILRYVENLSEQKNWGEEISPNVFFSPNPDNTNEGTQVLIDKIKSVENMNVAIGLGYSVEISRNSQNLFIEHTDLQHNILIDSDTKTITLEAVLDHNPEIGDIKASYQMDFNGERITNRNINDEGPFDSKSALGDTLISRFEKAFQPLRGNSFDKIDSGFEGMNAKTIAGVTNGVFSNKELGIRENGEYKFEFQSSTNDEVTIKAYSLCTDENNGISSNDRRALMMIECSNRDNGECEHYIIDNKGVVVQALDSKNEYNIGDVVKFILNGKETYFKDRNEHATDKIEKTLSVVYDKIAANIEHLTPDIIVKERQIEDSQLEKTMSMVAKAVTGEGIYLKENGNDAEKTRGEQMLKNVISYKSMDKIENVNKRDDTPRDITVFNREYSTDSSIDEKAFRIMNIIGKIGAIEQNASLIESKLEAPETEKLIEDVKLVIDRYNSDESNTEKLQWEPVSGQICNSHGFSLEGKYIERADTSLDGEITQNKQLVAFGDHVNLGILNINDISVQKHVGEYQNKGFEQDTGFINVTMHGKSELDINSEYEYFKTLQLASGGIDLDKIEDSIDKIEGLTKEYVKEFLREFPDAIETFTKIANDDSLNNEEKISEWQKCVDSYASGKQDSIDKGAEKQKIDNIESDKNNQPDKMEIYSEAKIDFKRFKNSFPRDFQNNFFVQFKDLQLLIKAKDAKITINEYAKKDFDLDKRDEKSIEKINNDIATGVDRYINAGDIAAKIFSITRCNMLESLLEVLVVKICTGISDAIHEHQDRVTKDENDEKEANDVLKDNEDDTDKNEKADVISDTDSNDDLAGNNEDNLESTEKDLTGQSEELQNNESTDKELTNELINNVDDEKIPENEPSEKDIELNEEEKAEKDAAIVEDANSYESEIEQSDDDLDDEDNAISAETDSKEDASSTDKEHDDEETDLSPGEAPIEDTNLAMQSPEILNEPDIDSSFGDDIIPPESDMFDYTSEELSSDDEPIPNEVDVTIANQEITDGFTETEDGNTKSGNIDDYKTEAVAEIREYLDDELLSTKECGNFSILSEDARIEVLSEVAKDVSSEEQASDLGELTIRTVFDGEESLTDANDRIRDNLPEEFKDAYDEGYKDEFDMFESFETAAYQDMNNTVYDTDTEGNMIEYIPSDEEGKAYVVVYSPEGSIIDTDYVDCAKESEMAADEIMDYIDSGDFETMVKDFVDDLDNDNMEIPEDIINDIDISSEAVEVVELPEEQSNLSIDSYWETGDDEIETEWSIFL